MAPTLDTADPFASIAQPAPAPPPSRTNADPFASIAASATPSPHTLMGDNPAKEAVYRMSADDGTEVGIPYSKIATGPAIGNGYRFADQREEAQFLHDYLNDPKGSFTKALSYAMGQDPLLKFYSGVGGEVLKTLMGLSSFINKQFGTGSTMGTGEVQQAAEQPAQGAIENAGALGENVAEFAMGDELLKAVNGGVLSLGEAAKLEQEAKKGSKVAQLALTALRQGAVAGGQTLAKTGGDYGAAATSAGATAATAGAIGAVSGGLSRAVARRATTLEKVGGVEMPVAAEVRNAEMSEAQRGGQEAIKKTAQDTATRHLEELNESRTEPQGPPMLPARTGPYQFELKGPRAGNETTGELAQSAGQQQQAAFKPPRYTTSSAPTRTATFAPNGRVVAGPEGSAGADIRTATAPEARANVGTNFETMRTEDPNLARGHIENLNKTIESDDFSKMQPQQQQDLLEARADAQRQMGEYHEQLTQSLQGAGRPNFQPVDIPKEVAGVGSFTEAAQHLENKAVEGYNVLNDATGGRFNAVRQELKDAWAGYHGASGEDAQRAAEANVTAAEGKMTKLIDGLRGVVNDRELDGFNDAFRNAQGLKRVAAAVDGSFQGNPSSSARSWEYRGFDGNRLMGNLTRLETRMGRGPLQRLLGPDGLNTLYQVAELNRTQAARAKFGAGMKPVIDGMMRYLHVGPAAVGGVAAHAAGLPWEAGAIGGMGAAWASKKVMNAVLTNPQVARNLIYAMDYGAKPENYGPMIAGMIVKGADWYRQSQQPQQNGRPQ
jgi:hypothetical protein